MAGLGSKHADFQTARQSLVHSGRGHTDGAATEHCRISYERLKLTPPAQPTNCYRAVVNIGRLLRAHSPLAQPAQPTSCSRALVNIISSPRAHCPLTQPTSCHRALMSMESPLSARSLFEQPIIETSLAPRLFSIRKVALGAHRRQAATSSIVAGSVQPAGLSNRCRRAQTSRETTEALQRPRHLMYEGGRYERKSRCRDGVLPPRTY